MSKPITKPKRTRLHPVLSDAAYVRSPEGRANLERIGRELLEEDRARMARRTFGIGRRG
jgi:hypothetical protein